jgi:DNA repair protein RadC
VIAFEEMFRGTIDCASVYPREILKRALSHNAAAVILAHNHPSGDPKPSAADRSLTQKLKSALGLVDIRVLDHFVIGDGECVSFAELGML